MWSLLFAQTPAAPPAGVTVPSSDQPAAALVWTVAILCTLVILSIVCVPSRKG